MTAPQQSYFDFHYEDEDNLFEEINEFYAFQEVEQLAENLRIWQQSSDFKGGASGVVRLLMRCLLIVLRRWVGQPNTEWTTASASERKLYVISLLENLEHQDSYTRYATARRLLYLLQGTSWKCVYARQ